MTSRVTSTSDLAASVSTSSRASCSDYPATAATSGTEKPPWKTDKVRSMACSLGREQVVGPLDRALQGGLPLAGAAGATRQQAESVVEQVTDLPDRHGPGPGGGQFDGEGDPVEALDHLGNSATSAWSSPTAPPAAAARSQKS